MVLNVIKTEKVCLFSQFFAPFLRPLGKWAEWLVYWRRCLRRLLSHSIYKHRNKWSAFFSWFNLIFFLNWKIKAQGIVFFRSNLIPGAVLESNKRNFFGCMELGIAAILMEKGQNSLLQNFHVSADSCKSNVCEMLKNGATKKSTKEFIAADELPCKLLLNINLDN